MSLEFVYTDVSQSAGQVTKKLVVTPSLAVAPSGLESFQFNVSFNTSELTLGAFRVAPTNAQVLFWTNPTTVSAMNASGLVRASAASLSGLTAQSPIVELEYTFAEGTDPEITFSSVLIDDQDILSGAEVTTTIAGSEVTEVETATVASVVGSTASRSVVTLDSDQIALSIAERSVGDEVPVTELVILKSTATTDIPAAVLSQSTLVSTEISDVASGVQITITLDTGAVSTFVFDTTSGVLVSAVDEGSPDSGESEGVDGSEEDGDDTAGAGAGDDNSGIVEDGVNTGSGVTDPVGIEVVADEVVSVFAAATTADVVYRQRLDDAVAFEAVNRDGSMTGKIIGDGDARTVTSVDNGSIQMSVNGPAVMGVDFIGLAAPASGARISSYMNALIDTVLPPTNPSYSALSGSWKSAVQRATAEQGSANADLKIILPSRPGTVSDEVAFGSLADTDAIGVVALPANGDVISMAGFESVITIGSGTVVASNAAGTQVFGDIAGQNIRGGIGSDVLNGGGGLDTLTGGAGSDIFEISAAGSVVITDLASVDKIKFDLFGVENLTDLAERLTLYAETANGLVFEFGDISLTLQGLSTLTDLQSEILFG